MRPLTVIEECQRLGALIINMTKFDLMKDGPVEKEKQLEKISVSACSKCGGQVRYSDFSYSFKCINGCDIGPK